MTHLLSITYFVLAGLCEIGGGYLVWLWLREGRSWWYGVLGAVILILYGVIPTLQPAHFGRVYAAYGVTSLILWVRVSRSSGSRSSCIGRAAEYAR
jgi:small multidrug resistance family-3 protein